jgi:hypothetical protein
MTPQAQTRTQAYGAAVMAFMVARADHDASVTAARFATRRGLYVAVAEASRRADADARLTAVLATYQGVA